MKLLGILALLFAAASCGGAGSAKPVETTSADVATMARFRTYSYAVAEEAPRGYSRPRPNPRLIAEVTRAVDAELQRRGYVRAGEGEASELVVRIATGSRVIEAMPAGRVEATTDMPFPEDTEGALVLDVFARGSAREVFHGFARQEVDERKGVDERMVQEAVSTLLEKVPPSDRSR